MTEPQTAATAIVADLSARWRSAFNAKDWGALSDLYAPDALFYGSTPALFSGRAGVRRYFSDLPPIRMDAFPPPAVVSVTADVIASAGTVLFRFGEDQRPYRLTWTIARLDGAGPDTSWLIAAHHASPV